jgi:hypothetical protein
MLGYFYIGSDGVGRLSSDDEPQKKTAEKEIPPDFEGAPKIVRALAKIQLAFERKNR